VLDRYLERALCEETMRANVARNALNEIRTHYSDWTTEVLCYHHRVLPTGALELDLCRAG